ncbi:MAG: trypsin-like peptidase domain-containing protein, partial [Rhodospirillaceae bacterium]|nr:trypsin-like peptidase domain-containing protein [Rhodospirillaceae bacterium]
HIRIAIVQFFSVLCGNNSMRPWNKIRLSKFAAAFLWVSISGCTTTHVGGVSTDPRANSFGKEIVVTFPAWTSESDKSDELRKRAEVPALQKCGSQNYSLVGIVSRDWDGRKGSFIGADISCSSSGRDRIAEQQAPAYRAPTFPNTRLQSDKEVCLRSIKRTQPIWDTHPSYSEVVSEAKRRGLDERQCAQLSKKFTEQQIAAFHPASNNIQGEAASRTAATKQSPSTARPTQKPKVARQAQFSAGSGFFVSKSGHVVTNAHVVKGCQRITVGDNANTQTHAALMSFDRRNDLALLKLGSLDMATVETKSLIKKLGIKVVPLVSHGLLRSKDVELGESVLVAGFPYGELYGNTIKVTGGMVSAVHGVSDDTAQFQMDAAAQSGNSGGPIYDENGNIVGVVVAQLNKLQVAKTTGSLPENVNFGIKASTVRQFLTKSGLPSKWSTKSKKMSTTALAKIAQKQTLMVMCHREPS